MLQGRFYTKMKGILNFVHKKRLDSLLTITQTLIEGGKLGIASLGNKIINNTTPKHNIKKVDRLIGNQKLEVQEIYSALAKDHLSNIDTLELLVDWCIYENKKFHVLQASLAMDGRSLPLYRDVYDITTPEFSQTLAEEKFLDNLAQCIPNNIKKVIIVTDAGFKRAWFIKILSLGWDFVARLRGTLMVKLDKEEIWKTANQYFPEATRTPKSLGRVQIGKSTKHALTAGLYVYFGPKKNRESRNKRYSKSVNNLYKAGNKEPWVILTSLSDSDRKAKKIIKLYKKRMQIEQNFRDDKNPRWGFGFRHTQCSTAARLSVYLLLTTIAYIFLLMIGYMAEKSGLKKSFQVNTSKRRVLSLISLGKLVVAHAIKLKPTCISEMISEMMECVGSTTKNDLLAA